MAFDRHHATYLYWNENIDFFTFIFLSPLRLFLNLSGSSLTLSCTVPRHVCEGRPTNGLDLNFHCGCSNCIHSHSPLYLLTNFIHMLCNCFTVAQAAENEFDETGNEWTFVKKGTILIKQLFRRQSTKCYKHILLR